jgi:glycosyltransferase involved in cell wall biosynthesis
LRIAASYRRNRNLAARTYALLRSRQRRHPVQVIVTQQARHAAAARCLPHRADPPSSAQLRQRGTGGQDPCDVGSKPVPDPAHPADRARLIGTFGFLSPYKGYETALRALHYLPEDHHLLIFGGIHPQTIKRELPLAPYIQTLFNEAHIGRTTLDTLRDTGTPLTLDLDAASKDLLTRHPRDLHHRVHFLGVHNDEGFMAAMALCDAVVLPYLEVGQSSSGPIAMALDMGCRVLASRTLAFLQFARYHPDQVEFFDIGNYAELADLISAERTAPGAGRQLAFNTRTNTALYLQANQPTRVPRHTLPARVRNYLRPELEKFQPDNARLDKNPAEKISADEAQKESAA